jgi:hypothetical protein
VDVEHAGAVTSKHPLLRRIMGLELQWKSTRTASVIYGRIARMYNREIHRPLKKAGKRTIKWTSCMVRAHFERHAVMVPRLIMERELHRLERVAKLLDEEVTRKEEAHEINIKGEVVEGSLVKKIIDTGKAKMSMARDYRAYVKDDLKSTAIATIIRSVQFGDHNKTNIREILETAALVNTAAGGGDRPEAQDLFDD